MSKEINIVLFLLLVIPAVFAQNRPIEQNQNVNLYAFIGEKISVTKLERKPSVEWVIGLDGDTAKIENIPFDEIFIARYKVIVNVFNMLQLDTIEFIAYDHYGRPEFEKNEYSLLYLSFSKEDSTFYHQKYQFDDVKKLNGEWERKNGESLEELFEIKKNGVFKSRGVF